MSSTGSRGSPIVGSCEGEEENASSVLPLPPAMVSTYCSVKRAVRRRGFGGGEGGV